MTYVILDKNGEEVRIPSFIRDCLSPDLMIYQALYLGDRRYRIVAESFRVTLMIYEETSPDIYRLISENEYTWSYWLNHHFQYVKAVNWLMDHDYILVANEYKVA